MPSYRPWLPDLLDRMADQFGVDKALAFAQAHGGRRLYLPARARADHPVARGFGLAVLRWLIEEVGAAEWVLVPKAAGASIVQQVQLCQALRDQGFSRNQIAEKTGLHFRTVERRLQAARVSTAQPDLFQIQ